MTDASEPDPLAGLPAGARRILRHVARFGFLTADQAARLDGRGLPYVRLGFHHLHTHGLLRTIAPTWGRGQRRAYALGRRARDLLGRTPDAPPMPRASLDRLDEILAAVDLAMHLEGQGAGRWHTWLEWRLRHPEPAGALTFPPAGVLETADGRLHPVWVLLHRRSPGLLRDDVLSLCLRGPLHFGEVYALPEMCAALERLVRRADVHPWTPPHLGGRPPLLPGWWKVGGGGHDRVAGAQPRLGPAAVEALRYLDRFGHATATQVARAIGRKPIETMVVLSRLLRRGLAQRHGGSGRRPHAWSATRAGLAAIGSGRQPLPAEPLHRRHTLALNDLAHDLAARTGGTWETEREVRTGEGRGTAPVDRRDLLPPPDGRFTLPDGRRVCIQLQLSPGQASRQCLYAHRYRRRGLCDEVWFVCAPDVAPRYRRALLPGDVGVIHVREWVAPDHSGGGRETEPWQRSPRKRGARKQCDAGGAAPGGAARGGVAPEPSARPGEPPRRPGRRPAPSPRHEVARGTVGASALGSPGRDDGRGTKALLLPPAQHGFGDGFGARTPQDLPP